MPPKFEACVKHGGRIRTVKPNKGTYLKVCYPKGGGAGISGEVKKTKRR